MFSSVWWIGPLSFPTYGGVVAKSLQELQTLSTLEAGGRGLIRWLAAMALQVQESTPMESTFLPQTIWEEMSIWMFPKIGWVPRKSSILRGFSIIKPYILGYPYFRKHPFWISDIFWYLGIWLLEKKNTPTEPGLSRKVCNSPLLKDIFSAEATDTYMIYVFVYIEIQIFFETLTHYIYQNAKQSSIILDEGIQ